MNTSKVNKTRIKDIAEKAKVSVGTVDRVLHNRGEVAEQTRAHVLSIIEKMGYTPNLIAKSLASKKIYKIAILIPDKDFDNPYWEKPLIGIRQAINEIKHYNIEINLYTFYLNDEESFVLASAKMFETEFDGLIFSPFFAELSNQIILKCEDAGIPYLFIDFNLEDKNNLAFFGQDAYQSGYLAARLMDFGIVDKSDLVIVKLVQTGTISQHLAKREAGFVDYFRSGRPKNVVQLLTIDANFIDDKSISTILHREFSKSKNIRGIFVTNSRAYKICEYLESNHIQDIVLIGYDTIDQNIIYLNKGIISFLIGQKPEDQGYKSVLAMFNYLLQNKEIEKINYSPIDIITKENITYYNKL